MKTLVCFFLTVASLSLSAQDLMGRWQLMKQSNCMDEKLDNPDQSEEMDELMSDFNSMKKRTPDVIEFKDKMKGEQSTTILGKRKEANEKNFLYRYDGTTLHLLDKKSRTIIASYNVEELSSAKLIVSDVNRPCEVRIFERIR
jgi:hypothetical protein